MMLKTYWRRLILEEIKINGKTYKLRIPFSALVFLKKKEVDLLRVSTEEEMGELIINNLTTIFGIAFKKGGNDLEHDKVESLLDDFIEDVGIEEMAKTIAELIEKGLNIKIDQT